MDNSEIDFIKERVLIKKEQIAREGLTASEDKELIRETIGERMEESFKNYPPAVEVQKLTPSATLPVSITQDDEEVQGKIDELVVIALKDNIPKAVTTALKTGNAFLIDKLHDTLVDKYYQELKRQKVI
ncbi:MAG: hypothetical protein WC306_00445 [Candidatus Paceibacterota bacterium]|jgi:hypothetical protein